MVWPTLNEPPLAIECNRTVRKLYLTERQVVRSVFVRGIDHYTNTTYMYIRHIRITKGLGENNKRLYKYILI